MAAKTPGVGCALLIVTALVSACGAVPASTVSSSAVVASIGGEVHDGNFVFTVTRFDSDLPRIRDHVPRGDYVAVIVTVKNVGDHPEIYDGANQKLKDSASKTYSTDIVVDATLNGESSAVINPGHQVQMATVFDIPPDAVPAAVELHESALSVGAAVNLDK